MLRRAGTLPAFPGWTLPGVTGAGGLQAQIKHGLPLNGERVVIAGSGPLLLAVASTVKRAGGNIVAIIEQAPVSALARFAAGSGAGRKTAPARRAFSGPLSPGKPGHPCPGRDIFSP
jgi:hypothetical protein